MNIEKAFSLCLFKKIQIHTNTMRLARRQAIITSAGTKRELLIGVKTHTLTCVMGIRWSWHLLTGYTESNGETETKGRDFLIGETPPSTNIWEFFAWL